MKKSLIYIVLMFQFFYSVSQQNFRIINDEFLNNSQAYNLLEYITEEIGHRYTGTSNAIKAEEFCYNYFKKIGLDEVFYDEFIFDGWQRGDLFFALYKDTDTVSFTSHAYANTTEFADINTKIIDLGNGLPEDFRKKSKFIRNNIVLVNFADYTVCNKNPETGFAKKAELAVRHKAKGIVIIDNRKDGSIYTARIATRENILHIPAIAISIGDGLILRQLVKDCKEARGIIKMTNIIDKFPARNVVGVLKGNTYPDEYILVGAHLDSWDLATGAMDNGIGAATVLDIARGMKHLNLDLKRSIMFVEYMGEEVGLLGASNLVNRIKSEEKLDNIKCVLNLDISGDMRGWNVFSDQLTGFVDSIGAVFLEFDDDNTYKNINDNLIGCASDHQAFFVEGIHTVRPNRIFDNWGNCYHADCDLFHWVREKALINSARYTAMMIYALANLDDFPERMSNEATKKLIDELDIEYYLRIWGHWKWD
jgi:carboxypeptidase Q